MNAELNQDLAKQALKWAFEKRPNAWCLSRLTDGEVEQLADLEELPFEATPRQVKAIKKAIARRIARIVKRRAEDDVMSNRFYGWVNAQVQQGGAWIHALAHEAKRYFESGFATKGRVIAAVRSNPELTMRQQPWGETPNGTALAAFRGKPVPVEEHEDQPLPIS